MPRARSPARDKAKELWLESGKKKLLKDIALELDVSETQIRKWKNLDEWEPEGNQSKGTLPNMKGNVTKQKEPEIVIDNDELTDKQKLFCFYYVKYFNATKAYQKAYGCSYATAGQNGHQLLKNTKVAKEINRLKQELFSDAFLDSRAILQKHIDIAFADITEFLSFGRKEIITVDGQPKMVNFVHLKESDEIDGTLINEIKEGREGVSIKLANREKSLDFLSKHYDLLKEEEKKTLQTAKLYLEVTKTKKEMDSSNGPDDEQIVFVDSEEAMERYIVEHGDVNGQSK